MFLDLDRNQAIIWDDLKYFVTEATFERRDTEGQLEEPKRLLKRWTPRKAESEGYAPLSVVQYSVLTVRVQRHAVGVKPPEKFEMGRAKL